MFQEVFGIRHNRDLSIIALAVRLFGKEHQPAIEKFVYRLAKMYASDTLYYHDFNHVAAVALRADEFAAEMNLSLHERRTLFIASMHHDLHHSNGKASDIQNITTAMFAFQNDATLPDNYFFSTVSIEEVSHAILCTIYPFKIRPTTTVECCLRDADITMSLEEDADQFAIGLQNEFANSNTQMEVTQKTMYEFAAQQRFYTVQCALLFRKTICL